MAFIVQITGFGVEFRVLNGEFVWRAKKLHVKTRHLVRMWNVERKRFRCVMGGEEIDRTEFADGLWDDEVVD